MNIRKEKNHERGNLVIAMAIALVVMIMMSVLMSYLVDFNKSIKRDEAGGVIQAIFVSLKGLIDNDSSWNTILTYNSTLRSCLSTEGANCWSAGAGTGNLIINNAFYNANVDGSSRASPGTAGLDHFGRTCSGFPSQVCPYKFVIGWSLSCKDGSGSCATRISPLSKMAIDPVANLTIELLSPAGGNDALNEKSYKTSFLRGGSSSIESACRMANADYDPKTQKCIVKTSACSPGYVLKGFDSVGRPVCIPQANFFGTGGTCPPSYAVVGFYQGGIACFKF